MENLINDYIYYRKNLIILNYYISNYSHHLSLKYYYDEYNKQISMILIHITVNKYIVLDIIKQKFLSIKADTYENVMTLTILNELHNIYFN